jgi:transcription antitermination protein NusB
VSHAVPPVFRSKARRLAMQAHYQWQVSGESLTTIETQFHQFNTMDNVDVPYFHELLFEVPKRLDEIHPVIEKHSHLPLADLNPLELIILRIAVYEILVRKDVPYKVIINEALELAKKFGATDGYKFVNGLLDKAVRELRADEVNA